MPTSLTAKNWVLIIGALAFILAIILRMKPSSDTPIKETTTVMAEKIEEKPDFAVLDWKELDIESPFSDRDSHASVVFDNKMWIMGGLNANGFQRADGSTPYWKVPHYSDIWNSSDGINWNLVIEDAPWGKKRSLFAIEFNGKLWMIGGWSPTHGYTNDMWSSLDGIEWTKVVTENPPPIIEGHQMEVFKGKLWMAGGVHYDKQKESNEVWSSVDGVNWVQVTADAGWAPRWDHSFTSFQGKLWITGGMKLGTSNFGDVWNSSDGKNWNLVTDTPPWQSRQGHAGVVYRDLLWLVGRFDNVNAGGVNDIWFTADGITWEKTHTDPSWQGREDHAVMLFLDKIWIVGGMGSDKVWRNDIWYSSIPFEEEVAR